jgi:hypothetical protein
MKSEHEVSPNFNGKAWRTPSWEVILAPCGKLSALEHQLPSKPQRRISHTHVLGVWGQSIAQREVVSWLCTVTTGCSHLWQRPHGLFHLCGASSLESRTWQENWILSLFRKGCPHGLELSLSLQLCSAVLTGHVEDQLRQMADRRSTCLEYCVTS